MKFRKKPVEIEAVQLTYNVARGIEQVPQWLIKAMEDKIVTIGYTHKIQNTQWGQIKTLEGIMDVSSDDYIIQGVKGELYPCKPDIFEKTYEKVIED